MQFSVLSLGGFAPALPTYESWLQWATGKPVGEGAKAVPLLPHIPAMLRRRLSAIGRMALHAAHMADPMGLADKRVYGSRHGDISRTLGLLEELVVTGAVSPAEFSVSVHNAIGALQGIATHDKSDYTTVSAGENTVVAGLIEACCLLEAGAKSVLVVFYDELLPAIYQPYTDEPDFPYGFALLLARAEAGSGHYTFAPHATAVGQVTPSNLEIIRFLLRQDNLLSANTWELRYYVG